MQTDPESPSQLSRRDFIRTSVVTAGVAAAVSSGAAQARSAERPEPTAKVIKVVGEKALEKPEVTSGVNREVVAEMLEKGLRELTGAESLKAALGEFIGADDVVGLKVNCLGSRHMATHTEIPDILVEALLELGLEREQIYVFERKGKDLGPGGYTITEEAGQVRCVGFEDDLDEEAVFKTPDGETTSYFPKLLTQKLTKIINLPVMKNHRIAGVTGALKNLAFGLLAPTRGSAHSANCTPFIVAACQREEIREPVVLHILDGVLCGFEGGPSGCSEDKRAVHNALYFSLDPVALDWHMREDLNAVRRGRKLAPVQRSHADHIEAAGEAGLGTADPERIELVELRV